MRLVTKTLQDQNIFRVTPRTTAAFANVVGELQEIFQIAYSPGNVARCMRRVHIFPFSYLGQLHLTRNYNSIPKEKREMMESQATFNTLVGGVLEDNQVLEKVFKDLEWPLNPERRPGAVDLRPINEQRAIIFNSKVQQDKLRERVANQRREVAKQKRAAKAKEKQDADALAKATENKAAVSTLSRGFLVLEQQVAQLRRQKEAEALKLQKAKQAATAAEKEAAALRKQLADLKACEKKSKPVASRHRRRNNSSSNLAKVQPGPAAPLGKRVQKPVNYAAMAGGESEESEGT